MTYNWLHFIPLTSPEGAYWTHSVIEKGQDDPEELTYNVSCGYSVGRESLNRWTQMKSVYMTTESKEILSKAIHILTPAHTITNQFIIILLSLGTTVIFWKRVLFFPNSYKDYSRIQIKVRRIFLWLEVIGQIETTQFPRTRLNWMYQYTITCVTKILEGWI